MKTFLLLLLSLTGLKLCAQDTILLSNGNSMIAHVTEINKNYLIAESGNGQEVQILLLPCPDVEEIRYANGYSEDMRDLALQRKNYEMMGRCDAQKYYNAGAGFGSGVGFGLTMIFGVIPACIVAAVPPVDLNDAGNPNHQLLLNNKPYMKGYNDAAHRKKAIRTGLGFALGFCISAALIIVAVSL